MSPEMEVHLMEQLSEIRSQGERNGQALADLAGPEGRITKIEKGIAWQDTKQWIHSLVMLAITGIVAAIRSLVHAK